MQGIINIKSLDNHHSSDEMNSSLIIIQKQCMDYLLAILLGLGYPCKL